MVVINGRMLESQKKEQKNNMKEEERVSRFLWLEVHAIVVLFVNGLCSQQVKSGQGNGVLDAIYGR